MGATLQLVVERRQWDVGRRHSLGPSGLTTPAYDLATGTQVFVGPFIGMMFGP